MTAGWCGTQWRSSWPGGVCPGSTETNPIYPTRGKNGQGGGVNEPVTENTVTDDAPWMADTSPVSIGYTEVDIMGTTLRQERPQTTVYQAMDEFRSMYTKAHVADADPDDVRAYKNLLTQMRKVTNSELGTMESQERAYYGILQYSARAGVNAEDLLSGSAPIPANETGGGGSGAYTGPRESFTIQAESDINATANALALEMIGRTLNEKELARVTKRIRSAEMEQPQVTTGGMARTVTEQGLTAQGREDILREVIAERPEYAQYQIDNTVLDTMLSEFKKREQMVNG